MERGGFIRGLVIAMLLIAIVGGTAFYAYHAGVAQGLVETGKLVAPTAPLAPYPYYGWHHFGFGFGAMGCFFPLLFMLLFFALVRGVFGHGHWRWKMHHAHSDAEGRDAPPMFEEWHKRAHEPKPAEK